MRNAIETTEMIIAVPVLIALGAADMILTLLRPRITL
jgi:hypothetical protein